jgi:hypothetical protein
LDFHQNARDMPAAHGNTNSDARLGEPLQLGRNAVDEGLWRAPWYGDEGKHATIVAIRR